MYEFEFKFKCHGHELQTVYRMLLHRYNYLTKSQNKDLYLESELKTIKKMTILFKECLNTWEDEIGRL